MIIDKSNYIQLQYKNSFVSREIENINHWNNQQNKIIIPNYKSMIRNSQRGYFKSNKLGQTLCWSTESQKVALYTDLPYLCTVHEYANVLTTRETDMELILNY